MRGGKSDNKLIATTLKLLHIRVSYGASLRYSCLCIFLAVLYRWFCHALLIAIAWAKMGSLRDVTRWGKPISPAGDGYQEAL